MAQNPLPPPPPSGGVLDGWLYLLWRRLTQEAQIFWSSIAPTTSADIAATVTDETGTAGNLVFSGNLTLQGLNVTNAAFTSRGITDNATATALTIDSSGNVTIGLNAPTLPNPLSIYSASGSAGIVGIGDGVGCQGVFIRCSTDANQPQFIMQKRRGTLSSSTAVANSDCLGDVVFQGYGGTTVRSLASVRAFVDTYTSDSDISANLRFSVSPSGSASAVEKLRIAQDGTLTAGGLSTAPALKVTPVASQARWIEVTGATSSANPTIGVSGGNLATSAVFMPVQATTAGAPAYVLGGMYYDTTLNKLRIGGATAWETVTSI